MFNFWNCNCKTSQFRQFTWAYGEHRHSCEVLLWSVKFNGNVFAVVAEGGTLQLHFQKAEKVQEISRYWLLSSWQECVVSESWDVYQKVSPHVQVRCRFIFYQKFRKVCINCGRLGRSEAQQNNNIWSRFGQRASKDRELA